MKRYKMVMFDMDGTLIDSYDFHAKCFQRFLRRYDVAIDEVQKAELIGNTVKVIFTNTLPEELHDIALRELSDFYLSGVDDLIDELEMIEGSLDTLAKIKKKDRVITLLTNSYKELVDRILDRKKLGEMFDMVEAANKESLNKESRCRKILTEYDIVPSDVLYVGDSSHDISLAKTIGMTGCLIYNDFSWLHKECLKVEDLKPDIVIDDISKVLEII